MKYYIIHYRYKTSEVAELYKLAKDFNISPDKLIKDRHKINCHDSKYIEPQDIFPKGGCTVIVWENGWSFSSECSLKDNYNKRKGVKICFGRSLPSK
jgi:hypothetical protein